MKRLTILRHAKSSWDDPGLADFDRPLNDRGRKAAQAIGRELKRRGWRFDQVVASPAVRVRETLENLALGYGGDLDVRFAPAIYAASAGALTTIVRELPDGVEAPLLVGHNPGLQELVVRLTADDARRLRERVRAKFPTAAVARIEFAAARWSDVEEGLLAELILPRELAD